MLQHTATHARLSLLALIAILVVCSFVPTGVRTARTDDATPENRQTQYSRPDHDAAEGDVDLMHQLATSPDRAPTPAELRRVIDLLNGSNWVVVGSAVQVLRVHGHSGWRDARLRVLRRAADFTTTRSPAAPSYHNWLACVQLLREILDQDVSEWIQEPEVRDDLTAILIPLASYCQDGMVRARALTILRRTPPHHWQSIVLAALDDPSERVRLAALDSVADNRWGIAATRVTPLASSARPELRRRAAAVLDRLGQFAEPREYGECVLQAAGQFADQLAEFGVSLSDASVLPPGLRGETLESEQLNDAAEAYLDRSPDRAIDNNDFQGVLLLAAAARAGQRKLTIRLWEREIARVDSDAELLERGLEAVARAQLLDGIAALRRGDQPAGLRAFTCVARLARGAKPHSMLQVYIKHAGQLAAAVEEDAGASTQAPNADDGTKVNGSLVHSAIMLLDDLDLTRPAHTDQAQQRLDTWCGLRPPTAIESNRRRYQPLAN